MRVLFSSGCPAHGRQPPRLAAEQIHCGPVWADARAADGRISALAAPAGDYDLAALVARFPREQQPDIVVCHWDSAGRNRPRNLAALRGPRVLLVGDTHLGRSPLLDLIAYASVEQFDRIVLVHDRHHATLLHSAGLRNLFWFPGLTFPHRDVAVFQARREVRAGRIAFADPTGPGEPRATRLLGALAARGLPLATPAPIAGRPLALYGSSLVGFNASRNGELNLRALEILSAGAALLTDRLAVEAGLEQILTDGREFASYGDSAELAELCENYLAHPDDARTRGDAGARWFDNVLAERPRLTAFRALAFDGRGVAEFDFAAGEFARGFFFGQPERLQANLLAYEHVQSLHAAQETVRVLLDKKTVPEDFATLCTTLPRVQLTHTLAEGDVDLAVFGPEGVERITGERTARLWCCDATDQDCAALAAHFAPKGFAPACHGLALLARSEKSAPVRPAGVAHARAQLEAGELDAAFATARAALERDLNSAAARVVLGEIALQRDGGLLAEKLFRTALALGAESATVEPLLAHALRTQRKFPEADAVLATALRAHPHDLRALLALAALRADQQQPAAVEAALREAASHFPASPVAAQALGDFLKRTGRVSEALAWHRRALGRSEELAAIDVGARRVRVAFVVQNLSGWAALESVWRALRDDLAFDPAIVATSEEIAAQLEARALPFVKWTALPLGPDFSDIVFLHDACDASRPTPLHAANLLRLVPRLAYVADSLAIAGGAKRLAETFSQPLHQFAWLVCARSGRERASYAKHGVVGHAHVIVTGHPKLDALRELAAVDTSALKNFAAGRKLVAWTPHYDVQPRRGSLFGRGVSTFQRWQKFLFAEFARRRDLAFVIRPHPRLAAEFAPAENVFLDRSDSPLPLFAAAGALLTDASSLVFEFAVTGKPLLYLHNPHGPQLGDDGEFVGAHCDTAVVEPDISGFLDRVAAGVDPLATQRAAACAEFLHRPERGAGFAIKQAVLARLVAETPPAAVRRAVAA